MATQEGHIVNACLDYLRYMGIICWRNNTGATKYRASSGRDRFIKFGHKGSGDILGLLPSGRFLSIECKTNKGQASQDQLEFMDAVNKSGGIAFVARSIDDVERVIVREIEKCS